MEVCSVVEIDDVQTRRNASRAGPLGLLSRCRGGVHRLGDECPSLHPTSFVAAGAQLIGDVIIEQHASVWFNAVVRGDQQTITVLARANIQDSVTIHAEHDLVVVGRGSSIGHGAMLHGCTIGDQSVVGMGAIVLDGARVGDRCFIAAGALVPPGMVVPDGSLVMGHPGRVIRASSPSELSWALENAEKYVQKASHYAATCCLEAASSVGR